MNARNFIIAVLVVQTIAVLIYTFFAYKAEGADLFGVFITNIKSVSWNGQFNLDFSCYLLLSAIWIVWRNKFAPSSFFIAIAAMIIGIMIFAPYLIWLTVKEKGNFKAVLIGER